MPRIALVVATISLATSQIFGSNSARALPLDVQQCTALDTERKTLAADGVDAELAKGPEWAKANLSAQQVAAVYRFLELKEQVLFRCPSLNPDVAPDPAEGDIVYGPPAPEKPKSAAKSSKKSASSRAAKNSVKKPVAIAAPAAPAPKVTP